MVSQPAVLVVGAGPTGLMLAVQLARLGVTFRIVDKGAGPTTQSRALVVHARSLEVLAQLGLAEEFVRLGAPVRMVTYFVAGRPVRTFSFTGFGEGRTAFPHLLVLEQSESERLLLGLLVKQGHAVEWQTELSDVRQSGGAVNSTLVHAGVSSERVTTDWLAGADGARSCVRGSLGLTFRGSTYPQRLFVLDCAVQWREPPPGLAVAFGRDGFGAFFPMARGRCRVVGIVPEQLDGQGEVTFEDVATRLPQLLRLDVAMTDPSWMALYRAHHRYAESFRADRCFLAGDAAHIHSPVGAQGMNTGLQDAYNLAWKLAYVTSGRAPDQLLDTYDAERRPVARRLVRTTDRVFAMVASRNSLVGLGPRYLGPKLLPLAVASRAASGVAFDAISQIGISYRSSPLSSAGSHGRFPRRAPRPGDRLPYVAHEEAGQRSNIQDLVTGERCCLLVFVGAPGTPVPTALTELVTSHQAVLEVQCISRTPGNAEVYAAFGIEATGYYVVRPDLHIGCRSNGLAVEPLRAHLGRWLAPGRCQAQPG